MKNRGGGRRRGGAAGAGGRRSRLALLAIALGGLRGDAARAIDLEAAARSALEAACSPYPAQEPPAHQPQLGAPGAAPALEPAPFAGGQAPGEAAPWRPPRHDPSAKREKDWLQLKSGELLRGEIE